MVSIPRSCTIAAVPVTNVDGSVPLRCMMVTSCTNRDQPHGFRARARWFARTTLSHRETTLSRFRPNFAIRVPQRETGSSVKAVTRSLDNIFLCTPWGRWNSIPSL